MYFNYLDFMYTFAMYPNDIYNDLLTKVDAMLIHEFSKQNTKNKYKISYGIQVLPRCLAVIRFIQTESILPTFMIIGP